MKEQVEHDIWYIDNWSVTLDVQTILRLPWKSFGGEMRTSKRVTVWPSSLAHCALV
jgi:lipopolysaccharide/colanic/teichoic acid biosynthesis glycosyltransferase